MLLALAGFIAFVFCALAAWHVWMALAPGAFDGAVPSVAGKPLFVPSTGATLAVALVLLVCAVLVAATAGLVDVGLSGRVLSWSSYALALGLTARAVGEFRYVGFFKRVRDGRFARLDTQVYSPLCLLLAVAVSTVAIGRGG